MFTGLIRAVGEVLEVRSSILRGRLPPEADLADLRTGDSLAVNGVCLTVTRLEAEGEVFEAFLSEETLRRTTLGLLRPGDLLNLERPLRPTDRLDGHIVLGHVDAVGIVEELFRAGGGWTLRVRHPPEVGRYIVPKGSVAVDGISLTVARKLPSLLEVAVIPETYERTNLRRLRAGAKVNIETDVLGRYIEALMSPQGGRR